MVTLKMHRSELDEGEKGAVIPERRNSKKQKPGHGGNAHPSILQSGGVCVPPTGI